MTAPGRIPCAPGFLPTAPPDAPASRLSRPMESPYSTPPNAAPPPPPTRREMEAVASFAYLAAALAEALQSPELSRALAAGGVAGRVARATGLDLATLAPVRIAHVRRLLDVLPPGPDWGDDEPGGPGGGDGPPDPPTTGPHVPPPAPPAAREPRPARPPAPRARALASAPLAVAAPEGSR